MAVLSSVCLQALYAALSDHPRRGPHKGVRVAVICFFGYPKAYVLSERSRLGGPRHAGPAVAPFFGSLRSQRDRMWVCGNGGAVWGLSDPCLRFRHRSRHICRVTATRQIVVKIDMQRRISCTHKYASAARGHDECPRIYLFSDIFYKHKK